MAAAQQRLDLSITAGQADILLDTLVDKSVETDHYLLSCLKDEPDKTDTCCDAHLARFEQRALQRKALLERKAEVQRLIALIEAIRPAFEASGSSPVSTTAVDLSGVTLVYRDAAGKTHEQPLTDIGSAGTLIDPDSGDDLELIAALVAADPTRTETQGATP
ncbi:hypothetical protein PUN71_013925 [Arthrobacter sp. NQ7]|uniref:hypothetical protein n=1 Tax=Arthrobacter sp. NQ7 TaxID=3032303 RepID=UPI00241034E5|nr:hypothetical protein [Arthrobacter sp. NQ7]MDJ0458299.1 hypothetical protein [Arthrobacter sp. NQ7]